MSSATIIQAGAVVTHYAPHIRNDSMDVGITVFDRGQIADRDNASYVNRNFGIRDNIVTNRPPAFTAEARAAWVQAREDAALERYLGGAA